MLEETYNQLKKKMDSSLDVFRKNLGGIRTGRASASILDGISVDYYGTPTPLKQVATISVPESRLLAIQPWDVSILKEIEKTILASDLGLTPNNDGKIIRLPIPSLTQEIRSSDLSGTLLRAPWLSTDLEHIVPIPHQLLESDRIQNTWPAGKPQIVYNPSA